MGTDVKMGFGVIQGNMIEIMLQRDCPRNYEVFGHLSGRQAVVEPVLRPVFDPNIEFAWYDKETLNWFVDGNNIYHARWAEFVDFVHGLQKDHFAAYEYLSEWVTFIVSVLDQYPDYNDDWNIDQVVVVWTFSS